MADKGRHKGKDPLLACDLSIARPGTLVHHELALSGWAAAADGIASVVVRIDGERELQASYGLDSPWLVEAIPDMPGAAAAAYELRLDTSRWAPGGHALSVVATDRKGRRAEIAGEVEVVPFEQPHYTVADNLAAISRGAPVMWLEQPRILDGVPELDGRLEVSGWAYAPGGIESVLVNVDRSARYEALRPISRADLLADYGPEIAGEAGFVLRLDPLELPPGQHEISVVAIAADRQAVGIEGKVICPPESSEAGAEGSARTVEWLDERSTPRLRERRGATGDGAVESHTDRLLEAERQLRYQWAAVLTEGRDALDAGRGEDWAPDLRNLPFDDASFDLITCFDVVHEAAEPDAALAELQRLLRPGGILLVSVPRLRVDLLAGNRPPELAPSELEHLARDRFPHVAVYRQQTCLSSLLGGAGGSVGATNGDAEIELSGTYPARPGDEVHTIVVAGAAPLPELKPMAVLASAQPVRDALASALMWEDRALLAEADAAASRTEANLAQMHQRGTIAKLRDAEARAREAEALEASFSWRITRPLRALKRRLGSRSTAQ